MILVLEIDDIAVPNVIAAVPDGSVSFGGEFATLALAAEGIAAELERRSGTPPEPTQ